MALLVAQIVAYSAMAAYAIAGIVRQILLMRAARAGGTKSA
jgi:hypothetical protein